MKRILITLFLTSAAMMAQTTPAVAPQSQTIKVRTGFDYGDPKHPNFKKRKPIYTVAEVRKGWINHAATLQMDTSYFVLRGVPGVQQADVSYMGYGVCGAEAFYNAVDTSGSKRVWEENAEVNYAVVNKKLWIIPPAALKAGVIEDEPLQMVADPQPPMPYCERSK